MKKIVLFVAALAIFGYAMPVHAATAPTTTATPQQNRMKSCAAQYHQKNIAKSQYHQFMSQCLKTSAMPSTAKAVPVTKVQPAPVTK